MNRPMPVFAPVTKAIFPSSFMLFGSKLSRACCRCPTCIGASIRHTHNFVPAAPGTGGASETGGSAPAAISESKMGNPRPASSIARPPTLNHTSPIAAVRNRVLWQVLHRVVTSPGAQLLRTLITPTPRLEGRCCATLVARRVCSGGDTICMVGSLVAAQHCPRWHLARSFPAPAPRTGDGLDTSTRDRHDASTQTLHRSDPRQSARARAKLPVFLS